MCSVWSMIEILSMNGEVTRNTESRWSNKEKALGLVCWFYFPSLWRNNQLVAVRYLRKVHVLLWKPITVPYAKETPWPQFHQWAFRPRDLCHRWRKQPREQFLSETYHSSATKLIWGSSSPPMGRCEKWKLSEAEMATVCCMVLLTLQVLWMEKMLFKSFIARYLWVAEFGTFFLFCFVR